MAKSVQLTNTCVRLRRPGTQPVDRMNPRHLEPTATQFLTPFIDPGRHWYLFKMRKKERGLTCNFLANSSISKVLLTKNGKPGVAPAKLTFHQNLIGFTVIRLIASGSIEVILA